MVADEVDRTVVFGSNRESPTGREQIVSAACTTNAIVPVLATLTR